MTCATAPRSTAALRTPMESYIRDINQTSLLNAHQERELAEAIINGDSEARDQMIRANLRLVIKIARGYTHRGLGLQDLIEEGNLGLLHAVEYFDPSIGVRFSTYASYWIKQSISRALVNTSKTVRIPNYMVGLLNTWRKTSMELQDLLGRTPTQEEIAKQMRLSKRKLKIITKAIRIYNAGVDSVGEDMRPGLHELLVDDHTPAPDAELSDRDELHEVMSLLQRITDEREKTVLRMRFGLEGHEPKTLKEIGVCLGLTRERVRQIERGALDRMRMALEN